MRRIAAVGVHDDLPAGQPAVPCRAAHHEPPRGIDEKLGAFMQQMRRNLRTNHALNHGLFNLLMGHMLIVLGGNHHCIHRHRLAILIRHGHLRLAVRPHPGVGAVLAHLGHPPGQPMSQGNGHGHHFRGFIAGKAKHHALISRAGFMLIRSPGFQGRVHPLGNVRGLIMQRGQHCAGSAVKALLGPVVADFVNHLAHDVRHRRIALGGHFAHHHHQPRGGAGFAGNAGIRILFQQRVQNGVGNLVAHFVGMAFGHGFGGKQCTHFCSFHAPHVRGRCFFRHLEIGRTPFLAIKKPPAHRQATLKKRCFRLLLICQRFRAAGISTLRRLHAAGCRASSGQSLSRSG